MKKCLILIAFLFSFFLVNPYQIHALELTEDSTPNEIIQVMRDSYPDIDKKDFVLFKHNTLCIYQYRYISEPVDGYLFGVKSDTFGYWDERFNSRRASDYINFNINNNPQLNKFSNSDVNLKQFTILHSSIDILNSDGTVYFKKNYSFNTDIEPTPTPTPTPTPDNLELPFTREEFLSIPFLLCVLICMLFFKWTFPMKGGKKI